MKRIYMAVLCCALLLMSQNAWAHSFWINLTESMNHPPGHVTSQLGFGHTLPIDDFLVGEHGAIMIDKYQLVSPDGKAFDMGAVSAKPIPPKQSPTNMTVSQGDLGLRKIGLNADSVTGTYQVVAESVPMYLTTYKDSKGKKKMAPKPIDQIKDVKEVVESFRFQSFAKAFFGVKKWSEPKSLGHALEIMPLNDMSDLHAGEMVGFKVTFNGKPVNASANYIASMNLFSNTYGGPDGFFLSAYIINGVAKFRVPTTGQWVANVLYQQKVEDNPSMKAYKGKCTDVFTGSSVGFTVKP